MMKFKKFLAAAMTGAMMLGMVTTAAPAVSTYAGTSAKLGTSETMIFHTVARDAEVPTSSAVGVQYDKMQVTVPCEDPYVVVKFYKKKANMKPEKPSNTYTYPTKNGSATIDLGFYKPGKEAACIICYKGSDTTEEGKIIEYELGGSVEKLSLKIDTSQDDFLTALKSSKTQIASLTGYSYRSLYGTEWNELSKFDYATAKVAGTTIVVRKDATATTPASAEAKLKIKGADKAPTLKITYEKDKIGVKNMEVAFFGTTVLSDADYSELQKADLTRSGLVELLKKKNPDADLTGEFTIAVRTHKDKKPASMPNFYKIKPVPTLSVTASGSAITSVGSGSTIKVEDTSEGNKQKIKFTISGDSNHLYEYWGNGKWNKITSGKEINFTQKEVVVRFAGQKEKGETKGEFPSAATEAEGVKLTIPQKEQNEGTQS